MKEIKFRGKRLYDQAETSKYYAEDKGTWKYGSYVCAHKYRGGEHGYLIVNNYGENPVMCDEKTIGQFTGLLDVNSVEIYENDKVKIVDEIFTVEYGETAYGFILKNDSDSFMLWCYEIAGTIEVTGNIHEND